MEVVETNFCSPTLSVCRLLISFCQYTWTCMVSKAGLKITVSAIEMYFERIFLEIYAQTQDQPLHGVKLLMPKVSYIVIVYRQIQKKRKGGGGAELPLVGIDLTWHP